MDDLWNPPGSSIRTTLEIYFLSHSGQIKFNFIPLLKRRRGKFLDPKIW